MRFAMNISIRMNQKIFKLNNMKGKYSDPNQILCRRESVSLLCL